MTPSRTAVLAGLFAGLRPRAQPTLAAPRAGLGGDAGGARRNKLRLPISKPLGDGLFEARGLTTGVRLFFVFAPGHRIVVLDGYVKKRTSIPARIMARIRRLQANTEKALRNEEDKNS